ncbi:MULTISPECIES: 2,3-epoxybenzoyl-CoA dihydrolase [Paraburkholderia]|uniref:2,3-dihydro-2,3-dihydroxybenzoyl-CoA ring cleavage enzyme n=1 Tax=Paraburkholderia megapolitana TaxID=420953 RepID=A0A1I3W789_9BURK|nr:MULTISPECIES: 2,3-epoxybenzoyl-CoA dihydrolase [Paraburkholderia]MCX4165954.1 2,3-epoxybenzoyl-CoA dihydrolase [Paraburkholderia megapolitana]MDN7161445.1 2,3-epoxybenzoyl-CoA dihydrolase [Paraburkholderia sp. CHISQ3]MDQ6498492.1 2,3-epoxybenzoyl-CoA dihydrolase [Paraburkholderia megapolitana]QDQ84617.1 benzoyl-CoA-dihydrodiol lyase [Paraburkholderia megapolitana]SFK02301.1 2,3-dihydro-2,3-dihydroxybenzoyl-CoA ring cleavage enzyme [Paraburkholderia megapolitana]
MSIAETVAPLATQPVDYRTAPAQYRHWKLSFEGQVATLGMDIAEDGGIRDGYKLKLNSYDLGVDIELHDAIQRIRFEHPEVRTVVLTSLKDRVFCSGANIFMLGLSSHAWKVNFCKFTNETRNGIEDSSRHSGLKFVAAVNGACAGGGYELAMACDEIWLVDDRSSSVALPEVPLLGVLPGTGGLTRLTDKRKVRHDRADIFCTVVEGIRGERAKEWRLVDEVVKPNQFEQAIQARALELAAHSDRPAEAQGVALTRIERVERSDGLGYATVDVAIDRAKRTATFTAKAPTTPQPDDIDGIVVAGTQWWPLRFARELDDAILSMRTNELDIGTWIFRTEGDARALLAVDASLMQHQQHWFVRETIGLLRRTLARIDVSSRSLFALIEPGSCFAGTFAELAFAADRTYMAALPSNEDEEPVITLSEVNFGLYPMVTHQSRLARRFYDEAAPLDAVRTKIGCSIRPVEAERLGLVTAAPDDIDWADEIRIALEERAAMSPDALTGLEANLRFNGPETMETRIFGRLTAWQNWIFNRPNAVGEKGALKVYGKGSKAQFDVARV